MSVKEEVFADINTLNETQLQQIADYLSFVKYQAYRRFKPSMDEDQLAGLYAEFADEDVASAEETMADYATELATEDIR